MTQDEEGLDLPDVERAKTEAVAALPDLVRETGAAGRQAWTLTSRIRDEMGQTVFQATLSLRATDLP